MRDFPIYKEPTIEVIEDLEVLRTIKHDFAWDIETNSLKPHGKDCKIVSCAIADTADHAYVFMMPQKRSLRLPLVELLGNEKIGKVAANCLHARSLVLMADGTKQRISYLVNNKITQPVLSYNTKTKKVEPKEITNWYREETKNIVWKKVITENTIRNTQSHYLTPDHKIYIRGKGMTPVENVKKGDYLLTYTKGLSNIQKQLILGSSLGDGCISLQTSANAKNPHFQVSHNPMQRNYLKWKYSILSNVSNVVRRIKNTRGFSNKSGILYNFETHSLSALLPIYKMLYKNKKKVITEAYLKKMSPLSFAVWYMDDGSLSKGKTSETIRICVPGFSEESIDVFIKYFYEKYNILFNKNKTARYTTITTISVGKKAGGMLFSKMIAPYIHSEMQYKIPSYYKGKLGGKVKTTITQNKFVNCTYSKITDIIEGTPQKHHFTKHCIEVQDNHNFFTTTGLMNNCKFEHTWAEIILGIIVKGWLWDTMLMAHVMDNRSGITGLKFLTYVMLGVIDYSSEIEPYLKGVEDKNANALNRVLELVSTESGKQQLLKYNALDAINTYRIWKLQEESELPF